MVRLAGRLDRLERAGGSRPALSQQWLDMLTRLYAAAVAYPDCSREGRTPRDLSPVEHTGIRETAERYARTGSPATISDLFRLVQSDDS